MPCEIVHQVTRPDGPYGHPVIRSACNAHGFEQRGAQLGESCPIGLIEAATDAALAKITACAGDPATENDGVTTTRRTRKAKTAPEPSGDPEPDA